MTDLSQWTVVLVDDELDSLNLVADVLALQGAEVHQAVSGREGLMLLHTVTPTIIVLDLAMPRPDGWDVLAAIRTTPNLAAVPVVAITAYYSEKVAQEAYRAGFDAFSPKPIKAGDFVRLLQDVISAGGPGHDEGPT